MKTTWFSLLLLCSWLSASATFKTVIGNAGTGWNVSSNWSPAGVPVSGDSVFIPTGQIITVKGAIYAVDALIHMVVRGTLDFEPSGKLDLLGESTLQIVTGGMITSDNNNSEVIKIGGITKFQGAVDPSPLNGPVYASQATGTSPSGFVTGTLATNIKNFSTRLRNGIVIISWTSVEETNIRLYAVERSMQGNWEVVKTVAARGAASDYETIDASPAKGNNFYRLKTVELSGTTAYSTVAKLNAVRPLGITALKQDRGSLHIMVEGNQHPRLHMQLMTIDGRMITESDVPVINNKAQMDISNITTGVYVIAVTDPDQNRVVSKFNRR